MTGINSGLDTDSIIQELMSAYNLKTEKYEKAQTKIQWTQDAWEDLNDDVNSFYKSVGNLKYSSGWSLYKATSSDSTKASVSVSGTVPTGTQSLHVLATAQSAYLTGAKITKASGGSVSSSTMMSELGFGGSANIRIEMKDSDGKDASTNIKVESTETVSDVLTKLQDAGLNASFDSTNGRFFVSAKNSGEASNFELKGVNDYGNELLSTLGLSTSKSIYSAKITSISGVAATSNTPMADLGLGYKYTYNTDNTVNTATEIEAKFKLTRKDSNGFQIGNTEEITLKRTDTIDSFINQLKVKGLSASFDADSGKIKISAVSGEDFELEAGDSNDNDVVKASTALLQQLGLGTDKTTGETMTTEAEKAVKLDGSNATIVLNGVVYTGSSNTFKINGMTITAGGTTDDIDDLYKDGTKTLDNEKISKLGSGTAININVSVDSQGIYDKIKDFLTSYNTLINKMTKLYNADSASDYEPLTDDEKDSMSDTEITKWETKIKDSLLRRDTSLSTIMSTMKSAMSQVYTVNGTKYALSSFGISTLYYGTAPTNEESAYHIDGDEDDENTSGNTDKLLAAINDDPEAVVSFMKQLATTLYSNIDAQMQSTTVRSRYSIYNDKELQDQYDNYTTMIDDWEDKVSDKEDYYYEMFANMESALATINSQQSALSGLVG
jgi:flagellar hook-associated protein 2